MLDWIIFVLGQLYNQIYNTSALYIFSFLLNKALHSHEKDTNIFSLFYLPWFRCVFPSPCLIKKKTSLPYSGTKSRFLFAFTQFAYEIHFSILGGKLFFISPYLIFIPFSCINSLDPRAYKLSLTQCMEMYTRVALPIG